jgi:DNA-binding MarR family transcriptional regulator
MSRPGTRRQALLQGFENAFRQMSTGAVMFHQAIADRLGLHATDHKCADLIARFGPMTAGALADRSALTTGAVTGVIDRLERAGLARRVPDPQDRRRVIIELTMDPVRQREIEGLFKGIADASYKLLTKYTDDQLELLLDFVHQCNALTYAETVKLRQGAIAAPSVSSAPSTTQASRSRKSR